MSDNKTSPIQPPMAFTVRFNGRANSLRSLVEVWPAFKPGASTPAPIGKQYQAIYDTGATGSAISKKVTAELGLISIGLANVHTAKGVHECETFLVNIGLPNRVMFTMMRVSTADLPDEVDMLVGMDVLCSGDFAVTNLGGKTTFSFRYPPSKELDFVQEIQTLNITKTLPKITAARNAPCPCGSGKKYKKCHGFN